MLDEKTTEIDYRTARLAIEGKLRGSRARVLAGAFERLSEEGFDQVLVDLRECTSLDSLGVLALRRALELGQRLFLVVGGILRLDEYLPADLTGDARFRVYARPEDALHAIRSRESSGVLVT